MLRKSLWIALIVVLLAGAAAARNRSKGIVEDGRDVYCNYIVQLSPNDDGGVILQAQVLDPAHRRDPMNIAYAWLLNDNLDIVWQQKVYGIKNDSIPGLPVEYYQTSRKAMRPYTATLEQLTAKELNYPEPQQLVLKNIDTVIENFVYYKPASETKHYAADFRALYISAIGVNNAEYAERCRKGNKAREAALQSILDDPTEKTKLNQIGEGLCRVMYLSDEQLDDIETPFSVRSAELERVFTEYLQTAQNQQTMTQIASGTAAEKNRVEENKKIAAEKSKVLMAEAQQRNAEIAGTGYEATEKKWWNDYLPATGPGVAVCLPPLDSHGKYDFSIGDTVTPEEHNTGGYGDMSGLEIRTTQAVARTYPGSTLNCHSGSGVVVIGGKTLYYSNFHVFKTVVDEGSRVFTITTTDSKDKTNPVVGTVRIADSAGVNYIFLQVGRKGEDSQILDVSLPQVGRSAQTMLAANGSGLELSKKALISLLNQAWQKIAKERPTDIFSYSDWLVINDEYRERVIEMIKELQTKHAKS